jgi:hypothetical protein
MPTLGSARSQNSTLMCVGLAIFLLSFFLPAVGSFNGFQCALFPLIFRSHDHQISSLSLFGVWLNPIVLTLFFLSIFRVAPRLRAVLTVTSLFSIPMTWISIHRMNAAGMFMDLNFGHFVWIAGILFIVLPNVPFAFSLSLIRWLAVAGGLIIAFLSVPLLIGFTMHPASNMDDFYYVVAWTLKEPTICGKINANAIGRPDQRDSTDLTYMQSDCYRNVAAMLHAPQLCGYVKSAGADRFIGSLVAKFSCRKQQYSLGTAMPGSSPNFVGAMRSVGFGDEQLAAVLYQNRPNIFLDPILNMLQTEPAFLSRLNDSKSYDEPFRLENRRDGYSLEFLDEIVAIQWDIPSLCQKISPNAQAREWGGYATSLLAACFSNIAWNHRDDSLCRKLPPDFREGCMKNVGALRNPTARLQRVHYGPCCFPTWPQFQEAAEQIGYPATTPWLQLPHPTSEEYEQYLQHVAEPRQVTDRADFVRRVLASQ